MTPGDDPGASIYWSSFSFSGYPAFAWYVGFSDGLVFDDVKGDTFHYVRAVRGGS